MSSFQLSFNRNRCPSAADASALSCLRIPKIHSSEVRDLHARQRPFSGSEFHRDSGTQRSTVTDSEAPRARHSRHDRTCLTASRSTLPPTPTIASPRTISPTTLRDRGINARVGAGSASARITLLRASSPVAQRLLTRAGPRPYGIRARRRLRHRQRWLAPDGHRRDERRRLLRRADGEAARRRQRLRRRSSIASASATGRRCVTAASTTTSRAAPCRRSTSRRNRSAPSPRTRSTFTHRTSSTRSPTRRTRSSRRRAARCRPSDIRELVAYAKQYHIDVIPEQEAFGHLHHVLKYEIYSPLAETPHGHVLAPGQPGSMPLIKQMFAEIDSSLPEPLRPPRRRRDLRARPRPDGGQRQGEGTRRRLSRLPAADREGRSGRRGSGSSSGATSRRTAPTS